MPDYFNVLDRASDYWSQNALTSGEATFPRELATTSSTLSSGNLRLTYFTARKTETVATVRMNSAGTAAGATPTLIRIGIWTVGTDDGLTALVASTASDTSLFAAANTVYSRALESSWAKVAGTRYAFGVLVVTAATAPSVAAGTSQLHADITALASRISAQVTGQTDLPATVAAGSLGNSANRPFGILLP